MNTNASCKQNEGLDRVPPLKFGVNYIPSKRWLHFWIDFDAESVRQDLLAIKALGFDHIRAHLLWHYFQINPRQMSQTAMRNLGGFTALCEEVGLDFCLSLFTGFMSGFSFFPAFLNAHRELAMFSGKAEREAERFYIEQIASVVASSPRFMGFDLGNELSCVTKFDKGATVETCDAWQTEMLACCESVAPGKLHNNGVDHQPWFYERAFSRKTLANTGAITPLHCWTRFTEAMDHGGLLGTASLHIAEYMAELVKAYSDDPARKIWIQEFGCSKLWVQHDGESIEEFVKGTFRVFEDMENLWGVTWWCSHDISEQFVGYHPLEYDLGLLDCNNNPKPYAHLISDIIREHKSRTRTAKRRTQATVYHAAPSDKESFAPAAAFMHAIDSGIHPAIVLSEQANDSEYLAKRGIETLLP